MAERMSGLPPFDRSGLRVVHHLGGWRIDVKDGAKQAGLDMTHEAFCHDPSMVAALSTLNAMLARKGIDKIVTIASVRRHAGASA